MEQAREEEDKEKEKKIFFDGLYALDEEDDRQEEESNEVVKLLKESRQRNQVRTPSATTRDGSGNARRTTSSREVHAVGRTLLRVSTVPDITSSPVRLASSRRVNTRVGGVSILPQTSAIRGMENAQLDKEPLTSLTLDTQTPLHLLRSSNRLDQERLTPLILHTPTLLHSRLSSNRLIPTMPAKRKRAQVLQPKPESQQIFKGLTFYFLPNDDIDPARRLRITRAREYGASWVKEWREGISYIIADRRLCLNDVLKYFNWTSIPAGTILVNESFPTECMLFRCMLDPKRIRFLVDGDQLEPEAKEASVEASTASDVSLQIKPVSKTPKVLETPSRTEKNSVVDRVPQTVLPEPRTLDLVKKAKGSTTLELINKAKGATRPTLNEGPRDVLEEAILEAGKLKHLPLDSENEDETSQTSTTYDEDDDNNNNSEEEESEKRRKRPRTRPLNQSTFLCMQNHNEKNTSENPNARTIEILQEMANYYERINDTWRPIAYRKAISILRKQPRRITTFEEASALPHIGERLALKIEEIVSTDRLRRLENTKLEDSNDQTLQKFLSIYGVGFAQASQWVSQGHKTLNDLLRHAQLNKNQRLGIEHYEDFNTRIPRSEVESLGAFVKKVAHVLDPTLQIIIMGSYRRGATTSSDIDLIITKTSTTLDTLRTIVLEQLIPTLFEQNFLKAALASTSPTTGTKWHGACSLPDPNNNKQEEVWRRIDFLLVPEEELGAAMIYFTGNDIFNRSMRLLARKKGMRLNQRGLWRDGFPRLSAAATRKGKGKAKSGELVEGRSESRIFEVLGVPWREAVERNA